MAEILRNRWPLCSGIGGRNAPESVADFTGMGTLRLEGIKPFKTPSTWCDDYLTGVSGKRKNLLLCVLRGSVVNPSSFVIS
jgi:hypothetical protein